MMKRAEVVRFGIYRVGRGRVGLTKISGSCSVYPRVAAPPRRAVGVLVRLKGCARKPNRFEIGARGATLTGGFVWMTSQCSAESARLRSDESDASSGGGYPIWC